MCAGKYHNGLDFARRHTVSGGRQKKARGKLGPASLERGPRALPVSPQCLASGSPAAPSSSQRLMQLSASDCPAGPAPWDLNSPKAIPHDVPMTSLPSASLQPSPPMIVPSILPPGLLTSHPHLPWALERLLPRHLNSSRLHCGCRSPPLPPGNSSLYV